MPVVERDWEKLASLWPSLDLPAVKAFWSSETLPENLGALATDKQLIISSDDPFVPESLKKVAQDMKARYRTSEQWARETDWLGNQPLAMSSH